MPHKRPLAMLTAPGSDDGLDSRRCDNCNKVFKPKRITQKYCSDYCRRIAYNNARSSTAGQQQNSHCLFCGKSLEGKRSHAKYCDSSCRGAATLERKIKANG